MQSIGLVLCIHCTAPPGPSGELLRRAFERAYLPLIEALWDARVSKVSMHWSGALLEWMESFAPEHLRQLQEMVASGKIEILGGLFGGALLPALPERDVVGQVQRSFAWWKTHGDPRIRGAWLPYCAWDPSAARILGQLGVHYTVLEENQLGRAGMPDGYLLTEREGTPLAIFPADERLAQMVPDSAPSAILSAIDRRAKAGMRCVTLAMAGERFGAALDASATRCFGSGRGWVRRFFNELAENDHWLKLVDFGTVLDRMPPTARVYPPASVSLPVSLAAAGDGARRMIGLLNGWKKGDPQATEMLPLLRRPGWDQLLIRNPELNRLHKKMLRTSVEVFRLRNTIRDRSRRGLDVHLLEQALTEATAALYRAQHGSAYVLGTEVGAQDGAVRHDAWSNLLRAEFAVTGALGDGDVTRILQVDADCDGRQDVVVKSPQFSVVLGPAQGGALTELDVWSLPGNLLNSWGRREEYFHDSLRKGDQLPLLLPDEDDATDAGQQVPESLMVPDLPIAEPLLFRRLYEDRWNRGCFQDRMLHPDATAARFFGEGDVEEGDFVGGDYQVEKAELFDEGPTVVLSREGTVTEGGGVRLARIEKSFHFPKGRSEIHVRYTISNRFNEGLHLRFGVEFNLNLDSTVGNGLELGVELDPAGPSWDGRNPRRVYSTEEPGEVAGVRAFTLTDTQRGMRVRVAARSGPGAPDGATAQLWFAPIEVVSRTPAGIGSLHQGVNLLIWWPIELWAAESRELSFVLSVEG